MQPRSPSTRRSSPTTCSGPRSIDDPGFDPSEVGRLRRARRAPGLRRLRARAARRQLARVHARRVRREGRAALPLQPALPRRPATARSAVVVGAGFAGLAAADALAARRLGRRRARGARPRRRARLVGAARTAASSSSARSSCCPGYDVLRETSRRGSGSTLHEKGTLYGDREPARRRRSRARSSLAAVDVLADGRRRLDRRRARRRSTSPRRTRGDRRTARRLDGRTSSTTSRRRSSPTAPPVRRLRRHSVAGGNDRIALALAAGLDVRLGSPRATSVRVERARASTVDGRDCDACVLATPAPATLAIAFDPPLPAWKRDALAAVRYGQAAKLFLPLEHAVEPSATLSVPDRFWTWTQHGLAVASSFAGHRRGARAARGRRGPGALGRRRARACAPTSPTPTRRRSSSTWPEGAYGARLAARRRSARRAASGRCSSRASTRPAPGTR